MTNEHTRGPGREAFPKSLIREYLIAAALHEYEKVCYLIEYRGLHPDSTLDGKPTALCYTVLKPNHCLMRYLLGCGADIHFRDAMGMTPLHYAVLGRCEYCLASLIVHGARLNIQNAQGHTPIALTRGRPELAGCADYLTRCSSAACSMH